MGMGGPDRLAQAQAVIASLFPADVSVAVTDPLAKPAHPLGPEGAHLTNAVEKRRREFAAGRAAVRQAMAMLGLPPAPIVPGEDRAPLWPDGSTGSISHSDTLCAAVVTKAGMLVGLDLEPDTPLSADLLSAICSEAELARIDGSDQLRLAKLIFSAKEASYKAQYPTTQQVFGFHHLDVLLDLDRQTFAATFVQDVGVFCKGTRVRGRFARTLDHVLTAATIPHAANKGD